MASNLRLPSSRYLYSSIVSPSGPGVLFVFVVRKAFYISYTMMGPKLIGGGLSTIFLLSIFFDGMCWSPFLVFKCFFQ